MLSFDRFKKSFSTIPKKQVIDSLGPIPPFPQGKTVEREGEMPFERVQLWEFSTLLENVRNSFRNDEDVAFNQLLAYLGLALKLLIENFFKLDAIFFIESFQDGNVPLGHQLRKLRVDDGVSREFLVDLVDRLERS